MPLVWFSSKPKKDAIPPSVTVMLMDAKHITSLHLSMPVPHCTQPGSSPLCCFELFLIFLLIGVTFCGWLLWPWLPLPLLCHFTKNHYLLSLRLPALVSDVSLPPLSLVLCTLILFLAQWLSLLFISSQESSPPSQPSAVPLVDICCMLHLAITFCANVSTSAIFLLRKSLFPNTESKAFTRWAELPGKEVGVGLKTNNQNVSKWTGDWNPKWAELIILITGSTAPFLGEGSSLGP